MGFIFSKPDTFLSQAKNTTYGSVLKERMVFAIYLHRGGVKGYFHDRIVVASVKYGFVTLELSRNAEGGIVPKCQQFDGSMMELKPKTEVECTFKDLAEKAAEILGPMAKKGYNVFNRSCQDFCNEFLKEVDAATYITTPQVVMGVTGISIFAATVRLIWAFLTGNHKK